MSAALLTLLCLLFGDPRAILFARVLATLSALAPCAPADIACPDRHTLAAVAIVVAATEGGGDAEADAAALSAIAIHETHLLTVRQAKGGSARGYWQVEPVGLGEERRRDAERLEADPIYAARRALAIWHRGASAYACGDERACEGTAVELRRYVRRAEWKMALH